MRTGLIALCAVLVLAAGCREASLDDLRGDAQDVLDEARNRAQALGELSADEMSEVWAIEYRTLLVPHADLGTLDEQLNALGQERWECYHVGDEEQGKMFYFQRRKSTGIANLTNLLRLGSVVF